MAIHFFAFRHPDKNVKTAGTEITISKRLSIFLNLNYVQFEIY